MLARGCSAGRKGRNGWSSAECKISHVVADTLFFGQTVFLFWGQTVRIYATFL